jgi:hypothetical protein
VRTPRPTLEGQKVRGRKRAPKQDVIAEATKIVETRDVDSDLLSQLLHTLQDHCGETGESEGAVATLKRIIAERNDAKAENQRIWERATVEEMTGVPLVIFDQLITANTGRVQTPIFVNSHSYEVQREPQRDLNDPFPERVTIKHFGPQQEG